MKQQERRPRNRVPVSTPRSTAVDNICRNIEAMMKRGRYAAEKIGRRLRRGFYRPPYWYPIRAVVGAGRGSHSALVLVPADLPQADLGDLRACAGLVRRNVGFQAVFAAADDVPLSPSELAKPETVRRLRRACNALAGWWSRFRHHVAFHSDAARAASKAAFRQRYRRFPARGSGGGGGGAGDDVTDPRRLHGSSPLRNVMNAED